MTGAAAADAGVPWWRRAVVYQVYPRSFADANGDGTGDIDGIRSRLAYLRDLGVDAIWVSPWYPSPLCDGGYDVSDHRAIDPRHGSVADAALLIEEARDLGIRIIVDLVPNHTSTAHPWFVDALGAGPGSPERARYHFRTGRGPDGSQPPTDWPSVFGGPAWTRVDDGDWYLHLFDPGQPDLNWTHPEVRADFETTLRFWLDLGVGGFRVDVAHGLVKHPGYADLDGRPQHVAAAPVADHPYWDRDELHDIYRSWRAVLDEYGHRDGERMMVAEASVHGSRRPRYVRPDEFHQAFDFDLLEADWSAKHVAEVIDTATRAARSVGSAPTWVLSNHDVMRHATRYGLPAGTDLASWSLVGPHDLLDAAAGARRARAAALVTLALPGSVYVYQGEELGLPEVWDLPIDVLDDPVWERSGHTEKGRDGCRVPIPWRSDGPSYGFGDGDAWLPQPAAFAALSAEAQIGRPDSMLSLYRRAIALRSTLLRGDEDVEIVDLGLGSDVLAFDRSGVRVVANMGSEPVERPAGEIVLASEPVSATLPGDTTVWLRR